MKNLMAAFILISILCSTAGARLPQIEEQVLISVSDSGQQLRESIRDIENGFLCLLITEEQRGITWNRCIGIETIKGLTWN
jgi:hypothetical protein